ncbi:cytidylate kinase family protein [Streptomyces sp. NPDC055886]
MGNGTRSELLSQLAESIESVRVGHPVRVAIDGPPAAGKTTLADELAVVLRAQGREVIRATIEGFLFRKAQRYQRGEYSPEGCYFDSHDHDTMCQVLLDPLGPDGDRKFQPAVYDRGSDTALRLPITEARADAVLLFDGVFLLRPELVDRWDLSIFMSVTFERTLDRARTRGEALAGSAASTTEIERAWRNRYIPSQQLYFAAAHPADHADIIVDNDELQRPSWEIRSN